MNYRISNAAISFGAETILEEINFEIKGKEKVAIVGRNGAGKTTFLNAISNNEMFEQGLGEEKFNIYNEGNPSFGYLKQISFEDENISMIDEILKCYKEIISIEEKMKKLEIMLQTESTDELINEYSKTRDRYEFLDGYTYKKEYQTAIFKFGFTKEDMNKKISEFSGGQRTKIAFIKLLLSKPDILMLDEPTNHLDIETIEWLETYLRNYPRAIIIVSHDRMFLNKIVNKVYEIEFGNMKLYTGNYDDFERQKKINYETELKDYEYQQKEIKRLNEIANRFRYKPTKAKMAMSKLKQIERMVKKEEPNKYDLKTFRSNFEIKRESGKLVISAQNLAIGYDKILSKVSFDLYRGRKLAIVGANGKGKSTLLKTLVGEIKSLEGKFEFGHNVDFEYFDQQMAFKNNLKTVLDDFTENFPELTITQARNSLAAFLFYGEDVFKEISQLSGGEKVRLKLSEILKKGPNLLILDEPTNHMDILGKENLEQMLIDYKGTLLFVSHDRYFVNKIADSLLIFEENGVRYFDGTYDKYLEAKLDGSILNEGSNNRLIYKEENSLDLQSKESEKPKVNDYFLAKEQNRIKNKIKKIEKEIEELEEKNSSLQMDLENPQYSADFVKLTEIQNEIDVINNEIENKMLEWEELENKIV